MLKTLPLNWGLYKSRIEPGFLKDPSGDGYISLRTCNNTDILNRLESLIQSYSAETGKEAVIASWISPPFGVVSGYGIYSRNEAEEISRQSGEERWGFPRFGRVYDLAWLKRKKQRLSSEV